MDLTTDFLPFLVRWYEQKNIKDRDPSRHKEKLVVLLVDTPLMRVVPFIQPLTDRLSDRRKSGSDNVLPRECVFVEVRGVVGVGRCPTIPLSLTFVVPILPSVPRTRV